jgi:YcaO-like protein with predicted kinase domain
MPTSGFVLSGSRLSAPKPASSEAQAEALLAIVAPLARQIGVTRLANITGLDDVGIPVFTAVRPTSRSLVTAQGKGLSATQAKLSALLESLEIWHAENLALPTQWATHDDLSGAVDPTRLNLFRGQVVDGSTPIEWVAGVELGTDRETHVPLESVSTDFARFRESPRFLVGSNGLASGAHLLGAIVHGLCECVERDAVALWYASDADVRPIDLDRVQDPACRAVIERVTHAGHSLAAWDVTSDLGVPVVASYLLDGSGGARGLGVASGFACHPSPRLALFRALVEAAQARATFIAGARDDLYREDYEALREPAYLAGMREEIRDLAAEPTALDEMPDLSTDSFEGDLRVLLDRLDRAGLPAPVLVDLTRRDLGLAVAKIVAPGLEALPTPESQPGARTAALLAAEAS